MGKKVKLLIEIEEEVYKSVENETYCGSLYSELRNGKVITDDCISRSALLNQIDTTDWSDVRLLVEDAPSIVKEND